MTDLKDIQDHILQEIAAANSLDALESVRRDAFGMKGHVTWVRVALKKLPAENRKALSPVIDAMIERINEALSARKAFLETTSSAPPPLKSETNR